MNLFVLSADPIEAAKFQCDAHIRKMIIETAQMLSTAHRVLDGTEIKYKVNGRTKTQYVLSDQRELALYKATHINHPCTRWVRQCAGNYCWAYELFLGLSSEYSNAFQKTHLTKTKLAKALWSLPRNIPKGDRTEFTLGMKLPADKILSNPIETYRAFYREKRSTMRMTWTNRTIPEWL